MTFLNQNVETSFLQKKKEEEERPFRTEKVTGIQGRVSQHCEH